MASCMAHDTHMTHMARVITLAYGCLAYTSGIAVRSRLFGTHHATVCCMALRTIASQEARKAEQLAANLDAVARGAAPEFIVRAATAARDAQ